MATDPSEYELGEQIQYLILKSSEQLTTLIHFEYY